MQEELFNISLQQGNKEPLSYSGINFKDIDKLVEELNLEPIQTHIKVLVELASLGSDYPAEPLEFKVKSGEVEVSVSQFSHDQGDISFGQFGQMFNA